MQTQQTLNYWVFGFICWLISERSRTCGKNRVSFRLGIYLKFHFIASAQKDSPLYPDVFNWRPDRRCSRKATELFCVCLCVSTVCSVCLAVFVCVCETVGYRVCWWVIPWMLDGDYLNSLSPFVTITLCLNRINHEPDMHTHTYARICSLERRKYESPDTYMCLPMCATLASPSHVPCSHNNSQQIKL